MNYWQDVAIISGSTIAIKITNPYIIVFQIRFFLRNKVLFKTSPGL